MVNEEILGGLRNALERGQTLDKAVQSFINAGYNPNDVKAAASRISQGASTMMQPSENKESPTKQESPEPQKTQTSTPSKTQSPESNLPNQEIQKSPEKPGKLSSLKKIKNFISPIKMETRNLIIIIIIAILLLIIGGLALLTLFSEQILQAIA